MKKQVSILSFLLVAILFIPYSVFGQGAGVWEKQCVDSSGSDKGQYNSLTFDSQSNPHISYYAEDFEDLLYATLQNGTWQIVTVDSLEDRGEYSSIVIDQQDRPHIAYKAEYTWGVDSLLGWKWQTDVVMHAVKTSTGWVMDMADSMMRPFLHENMMYTSIGIDANGNPAISYGSLLDSARLEYAHFDGTQWNVQHVRTFSAVLLFTKLVFRNGIDPIIAYLEVDKTGATNLRFAYWDAAVQEWKVITTPFIIGDVDVLGCDVDATGNLYFAVLGPDDSLRVATYDWQQWLTEAVYYKHDNAGIINRVSLKIDRSGQPAFVVLDSRQIHYLHKVAGRWERTFIEEWPVDWWPTDLSLAFDTYNNPSFSLRVNIPRPGKTGTGLFFYRYWPGNPQIEVADTTHDFGTVWTQSFSNWNCLIRNRGEAPLIISTLQFQGGGSIFQHVAPTLPKTIAPHDSGYITIRFTPPAATSFHDSLMIFSNDPVHPAVKVYVQGTGGTSGTTADLACEVQSAYIDHPSGRIRTDRYVENASVTLLQNGQVKYGPATTGQIGTATITGIPVGTYDLRISKIVSIPGDGAGTISLDTLGITLPITLGPGANSKSVSFPDSIVKEVYAVAYELGHIETSKWDTISTYSYPAASEIRALMQSWSMELPIDATESGARLVVSGRMVARMFQSGFLIGTEAINDIGELINFLMYTNCWSDSFLGLLKSLTSGYQGVILWLFKQMLIAFLKDYILDLVGQGVQAAVAGLPTIDIGAGGVLNCPKLVMDVWDGVRDRYLGGTDPIVRALPFVSCIINDGAWSAIKGDIYGVAKHVFFQLVYVDALTNPSAERAHDHSKSFTYTGDFHRAYENTQSFIADKTHDVGVAKDISEYSIVTAKLLQATSQMLGAFGTLVPGAGPLLDLLSTISNYASYAMVGTALGVSTGTFFSLPSSIDNAVDGVYWPGVTSRARLPVRAFGMPGAVMPMETRRKLRQQLAAATAQYDSVVQYIESQIRTGRMVDAVQGLDGLTKAERTLRNGLKMSAAPLYAVAPYARDSVAGFQVMYDSIWASHAKAGLERFENCLYIATLLADSNQSIKDSVIAQLDRSLVQNGVLAGRMSAALDSIASLPLPAVIVFSQAVQDVYTLEPGSVGTVTLRLKNLGGLRADSVWLHFKTVAGIRAIEAESVSVGTLLPGQESQTFTWHLGTYGSGFARGLWTASVNSSNAKSYAYSGLFSVSAPSTPGTGGRLANENVYNYPNPFNPDRTTTTVRYSLATSAQVTIRIYDAGGNLVRNLLEGIQMNAGDEQASTWDGRNGAGDIAANGVYFYVVESSAGERAVGKIAVLR